MLRELNVADFLPPEKKQEKSKVESTSVEDSPASIAAPLTPGDDSVGMDVDTHASVKKYKMTEAMKGLIWNLVCLSNECCRIENEKMCVRVQSDPWLILS